MREGTDFCCIRVFRDKSSDFYFPNHQHCDTLNRAREDALLSLSIFLSYHRLSINVTCYAHTRNVCPLDERK